MPLNCGLRPPGPIVHVVLTSVAVTVVAFFDKSKQMLLIPSPIVAHQSRPELIRSPVLSTKTGPFEAIWSASAWWRGK